MANGYSNTGTNNTPAGLSQATGNNAGGNNTVGGNSAYNNANRVELESSKGVGINDSLQLPGVSSKVLNRKFGREGDYVEIYVYNTAGELVFQDRDFYDYILLYQIFYLVL